MPTQSEGVAHIAATGRARRRPFPLAVNAPPNGPACWWADPRVTPRPAHRPLPISSEPGTDFADVPGRPTHARGPGHHLQNLLLISLSIARIPDAIPSIEILTQIFFPLSRIQIPFLV